MSVGHVRPTAVPSRPGPGIAVSCRGLVYIYRRDGYDVVALAGVDLDLAPGESVALLGPSGSGKSTLLAVLAGLLPPAAGKLTIGAHDVAKASQADLARMRATSVGLVLQGATRNLLPYLSAEQNVRFARRAAPAQRRRALPAAADVLGLVGLGARAKLGLRPQQLAPGERQRLAVAVALASQPGLLLADEPTSQLDSRSRDDVVAAIEAAHHVGTTVVIVTHDPAVSARMGRTVTIRDGRVGAEGLRGGEDFAVVGRDGSVHLPMDVLSSLGPGRLVRVVAEADGTARLMPAPEPEQRFARPAQQARPVQATRPVQPGPQPTERPPQRPPHRGETARGEAARGLPEVDAADYAGLDLWEGQ